jgi:hypothetical protein
MNLVDRLRKGEGELKELIDRIAERQGSEPCAQVERAWLMRGLAGKLADMRGCIEGSLAGLDEHARSLLEYRVRVELPLYSHLDSLSAMSREFVDWTASDPALGLTAIPSR